MIDTDKYEGHVADFGKMWTWSKWALLQTPTGGCSETKTQMDATSALLNDAPKLLAEVKRLRERLIRAYDWAENVVNGNDSAMMDYTEYVCGGD